MKIWRVLLKLARSRTRFTPSMEKWTRCKEVVSKSGDWKICWLKFSHAVKVYRKNLTICKKLLVQKMTPLKCLDSKPDGFLKKADSKSDCILNFWFVIWFFFAIKLFRRIKRFKWAENCHFWRCYRAKQSKVFFWNWVFQRTLVF